MTDNSLTSTPGLSWTGDARDDHLTGGAGNDTLYGYGGGDRLYGDSSRGKGKGGADTLAGGQCMTRPTCALSMDPTWIRLRSAMTTLDTAPFGSVPGDGRHGNRVSARRPTPWRHGSFARGSSN